MSIDLQALRAIQTRRAAEVIRHGVTTDFVPRYIAGGDVGFEQEGTIARAALVVLSWPDLQLVEYHVARVALTLPYIPGYLSFREYPALEAAWQQLKVQPDLLFIDGHGVAHPRGLGVASHFGLIADIPTIGVAKRRLCGSFLPLTSQPGESQPLILQQQQVGWVLRSKLRCNPLFISAGHKISDHMALYWTKQCLRGYRLPEPTRWADAVASQRPSFQRWLQKGSGDSE